MSGPIGVGGDAQNVQLPMLQHALRPQRSAAPTEPSGDYPSGGSCAIYIGMSSIRSIHSIRRTKSQRKSLATNFFGPFPQEIARHKLFQLISSGNRSPQTFSAHFLRKSPATNFFGSFPQEIARHKTFSANCLRKSREKDRCAGRRSWPGTECIRNVTKKTSPATAALLFFS